MLIRPAQANDAQAIADIILPIFRAGETYAIDRDISRDAAIAYWMGEDRETFVAEDDGRIIGTYYLKRNQAGGGSHVANCGYMSSPSATGRGVASQMCAHSQEIARARGFRAMQFNFVVSTNVRAVALWQRMGFATLARLPGAFQHPEMGDVDALVMFKRL